MTTVSIAVRVRVAWWVQPYLWTVARLPLITRRTPDLEKVKRRVLSGVKVQLPK